LKERTNNMHWKEGGQYENPPAGSHLARCIQVIDLGTQKHSFGGEEWTSRDVRITWELPTELMEGKYNPDVKGKPFAVSKTFKQSLHNASSLRGFLESWRGKKFTKEELSSYDPRKLPGIPCRITLIENGDYVNVDGIAPIGRNEKCPDQVNPSIYFSLEPDQYNPGVMASLTDKTREKIQNSPEFAALAVDKKPEEPAKEKEPEEDVPF